MRSGSTCCNLHKTCERCHAQLKNEIMNGNQGDHVTFVWTWRRSKQRWGFVTHFINLFNTTMPMPCTDVHSETPMSHFWYRRVGMGCLQVGGDTWFTHVRPSGSHLPFYVRRTLIGYTEKIHIWVDIFSFSGADLADECHSQLRCIE